MSKLLTAVFAILVLCSSAFTDAAADTLGNIKTLENGANVSVSGPIVTAIKPLVPDGFYVETTDRSAGIKVISAVTVQLGDSLSIEGIVGTRGSEKVIEASSVTVISSGNPVPTPIGMNNKALLKRPDSMGKNIKIWGRVSGVDTANPPQWFSLDDASGTAVKCKLGSGVAYNTGWSRVAVAGVASVEDAGGQSIPVLLVGSTTGIQSYIGGISGKVTLSSNQVKDQLVESLHPYLANSNEIWTITGPSGTIRIRCHFTEFWLESGYDYLKIKDGADNIVQTYNNSNAAFDVWSLWIAGDTVKLHLTSDGSMQRYGFQVDKYEVQLPGTPVSGVTLTLMPGNITRLTGVDGAYSFTNLSAGAYTVTPSLPGAIFTPSNRTVTVTSDCLQDVSFVKN